MAALRGAVCRVHIRSAHSSSAGGESTRLGEVGSARVGRDREPGREDVLAERLDDALTGGALVYRGDQLCLAVAASCGQLAAEA
jgi:hypothetical protein